MKDISTAEKIQILVVEDEEKLCSTIQEYLQMSDYQTMGARSGAEAVRVFSAGEDAWPDLVLLDLMLPEMSGFDVLTKIREKSNVPVIILTAKCSEEDQLRGFSLGADDYLVKPFLLSVLKAHIEALMRRAKGTVRRKTYGALSIDDKARKVFLNGQYVPLTPREYEVLRYFTDNEKIVLRRDRFLDEVWGIDYNGTDRSVDTIVKQIRLKLGKYGKYIDTIYGIGYRFEVKDDEDN